LARRIAFLTSAPLSERAQGLHAENPSVRRAILAPARALEARGFGTHVLSLPTWPREQVLSILAKADRIVLSRKDADALEFVAGLDMAQKQMVSPPDAPLCAEVPLGRVRVPRRGWRERAGLWFARRGGVGLDPWRVKLLWFDERGSARAGMEAMSELRALSAEVPLLLECVTPAFAELSAHVTPPASAPLAALKTTAHPWSPAYLAAALEECDAVVLPRTAETRAQWVEALQAGRSVIARATAPEEALGAYGWTGTSLADGVRWLLRHPGEALRRVTQGQAYVARHHSLEALAAFWERALDFNQ
jgi:hypothetical protein